MDSLTTILTKLIKSKEMSSEKIEETLGYVEDLELISRDNLALDK